MSNAAELGALVYDPEASWGEDVVFTGTHRFPLINALDLSGLKNDKVDPKRVNQYMQDGQMWIRSVMGGTIKTQIHATGHGSSTAGATTVDALETILSYIFSGAGALGAGGTVSISSANGTTCTGGTSSVPITAAASGFLAGSLCRIGSQNDGRGNGQAAAVSSHASNNLTLLTAIDGTPNSGDVVYSGATLYLPETPQNTVVTSIRLLALTANLVYELRGCWPMNISLKGTEPGQLPYWDIEWGISWWRVNGAQTFPSVVASNQYLPAPVSGGSLFVNDVGTATRAAANKRSYRQFEIAIKLGIVPQPGPGSVNSYGNIVAARRVPSDIRVKWTEDADAETASPVLEGYFMGTTSKHVLWTHNTTNGMSVACYFPQVRIVGARPVQKPFNKINSIMIDGEANTGPTTTTDLTASAFRFLYS